MEKQLLLKFLKQQLHGFKNCYINLQVSVTMSNKNDKHIGTQLELTNRLKAVLTNIRNNNMQRITHLPESITTTKFDHIANFGTQSEVYIAAKELAVTDTKQLIDYITDMNERFIPKIKQPWMNMILFTWPIDFTDEQLLYRVNKKFKFKDNDENDSTIIYIFDGIIFNNDNYIAYYHDINHNINDIYLDNNIICKISFPLLVNRTYIFIDI
jgi:hypothetical protein